MYRAVLTAIVACWTFHNATPTVVADVIAHWTFDADFTDSSASANHLSIADSDPEITTADGDWKFGGGALDLDGNDSLSIATAMNFASTDAWSVSFWGKRHPSAENRDGMIIGEVGNRSNFIWTPDNPSVVRGIRFRNSDGGNADYSNIVDDQMYHHWVVIADGTGKMTAYRDNVSLGEKTLDTAFDATAVAQAYTNQAPQAYYGQIDELYVFDEAIGTDIVESLFTSNRPVATPELLGDMNEDGIVDRSDVSLFSENYGIEGGSTFFTGDFNADDATSLGDLALLQANLGATAPAGQAAAVPEPSALIVLMIALALCGLSRRTLRG